MGEEPTLCCINCRSPVTRMGPDRYDCTKRGCDYINHYAEAAHWWSMEHR